MSQQEPEERIAPVTYLFGAPAPAEVEPAAPEAPAAKSMTTDTYTITPTEYSDHMQLSLAQLETVTLMLQVLDQADGGPAPTE